MREALMWINKFINFLQARSVRAMNILVCALMINYIELTLKPLFNFSELGFRHCSVDKIHLEKFPLIASTSSFACFDSTTIMIVS